MYQPPQFREDDPAVQHALIRAHPLGLLISSGAAGIQANPVPFLMSETDDGPRLNAHLAKANPQIEDLRAGGDVLVVFQGADDYITPSWYAAKKEHGKVVPTWNYAIVQVRGQPRLITDADWLHTHVDALTRTHEAGREAPWAVTDAPADFIARQVKGIVGLEIAVTGIDAKWKVSQNRSVDDRRGVADGLASSNPAMANLVSAHVPESGA